MDSYVVANGGDTSSGNGCTIIGTIGQAAAGFVHDAAASIQGGFWSFEAIVTAQSTPPPVSVVRSFVNDIPDQPLVTISLFGASNVACMIYEESLPAAASALSVSGDGVYLPALNAIRWGPYFSNATLNVSYRLTGWPASYPVNGGSWMDGHWYFSPGETLVTVRAPGIGAGVPAPPPRVAAPVFTPASGSGVPAKVTISCATTGAVICYTLDGSLPTQSSLVYTGAVALASASMLRAAAFTNGWLSSEVRVAFYGPPAMPAATQVARGIATGSPAEPVVTFSVTPGTNAGCVAVTETLPIGLAAANITAGGNYIASDNVILWGPFFGTTAQTLSYQAVGRPGAYPVRASWSVDGVDGGETTGTNVVIAAGTGNSVPPAPSQVAAPLFTPASGSPVPLSLILTDATPGALIYYTLDGALPTQDSLLYTGAVSLASAAVVRAAAFTHGWLPSEARAAFYGPATTPADARVARSIDTSSPATPVVTFSVTPGADTECVAVTETLPAGIGALNISSGGNYIAADNLILWGPFFGTNAQTLSYQAVGEPGVYPVTASWSVDGVSGNDGGASLLIVGGTAAGIPMPPQQAPKPVLSPASASGLPVTVTISDSDASAQIFCTTDGALPTQSSTRYTGALTFDTRTTLRAVAFRDGYLPSMAVVGEYVPAVPADLVPLEQSVSGNGGFLPTVLLAATPASSVSCYAVLETLPFGLTPSMLSGDGSWDPISGTIRWGPYVDNQPRVFSFNVAGASGSYALSGQVSYDGYASAATGSSLVEINADYSGPAAVTSIGACASDNFVYNLEINPAPGLITVTSASGTVDWGDGTQSPVTQPVMTLLKTYTTAGIYAINITANWTGYAADASPQSGVATITGTVQAVTDCAAPQVSLQPTNQVVLAGSTVQFRVGVSSSVPMNYQWYFDQTFPIVGATAPTLNLSGVEPQSSGLYSLVITNAFGGVTSRLASLTVIAASITNLVRNPDGSLTLSFVGLPNTSTRLWATTNLALPSTWRPIYTNTTTTASGAWQYTDPNASDSSSLFYRFSTP